MTSLQQKTAALLALEGVKPIQELFSVLSRVSGDYRLIAQVTRYKHDPFGLPDHLRLKIEQELRFFLEQSSFESKATILKEEVEVPTIDIDSKIAAKIDKAEGTKQLPYEVTPDNPKEIIELRRKRYLLYEEYRSIKEQMANVPEDSSTGDNQRYELAYKLMEEVLPEITSISDIIKEWESKGKVPLAKIKEDVRWTIGMMKKRESLRSSISRLKSQLKKEKKEKKRYSLERDIEEKQNELDSINYDLDLD